MKHEHFAEIDSTQDYLISINPEQDYIVSCDYQSQGRGQRSKQWDSYPSSLCFSFTLKPHPTVTLTALELAILINNFFKNSLQYKWPNDLMDSALKKCGGIIIQGPFNQNYIAGIGLNLLPESKVNLYPNGFGGILSADDKLPEKKRLAFELVNSIHQNRLEKKDVISHWTKQCSHLNQRVEIRDQKTRRAGQFVGIGEDGEALIHTDTGLEHFYSGSLFVL